MRRRTRRQLYLISEVRPNLIPGSRDGFPLGVDNLGRDELSRLILGSRQSLLIGIVSTALGLAAGMALGILAGGLGGKVDTVVMRFVDIMLSIPVCSWRSRSPCCWGSTRSRS
ncbi:MAG: hypothetical protein WKF47_02935 [Geodermatophilaceae bacterium]